jgi:hypothetical protein
MEVRSRISSLRGSDSTKSSLPKGWVYEAEEARIGVKTKMVDLGKYQMLDAPLTRHKHKWLEIEDAQLHNPYCQHRWASNITGAPPIFHSASTKTAVKRWRGISGVTDLQGPPSERTPEEKLWDFKTRAQQYARDRESCDDVRISYLEFLETEAEDDLALARMIAG